MDLNIKDFFDFIIQNISEDPLKLTLASKKRKFPFDIDSAILQIECRNKYAQKFPLLLNHREFIFPDSLSPQQASSQAIARFHSSLIPQGSRVLDITAGLGVDAFTIATEGNRVTAIEYDTVKTGALRHNIHALGLKDFEVIEGDSIQFLKNTSQKFDIIFADPARRGKEDKRLYNLHDCSPDIIRFTSLLLEHADQVLIKASPLLDISQTIRDFPQTTSIKAVGVKGECKEILIELSNKEQNEKITAEAINLDNQGNIISFFNTTFDKEATLIEDAQIRYANIEDLKEGKFLLEPSAMVMKLAPWSVICKEFEAMKFAPSSHLFISDKLPVNFPGRVTQIQKTIKNQDRKSLAGFPASVISRNYPLSSDRIRKNFRLKEGEDNFIYASRIADKPLMLLTSKSITG